MYREFSLPYTVIEGDDVGRDGRNYLRNTILALAKINKPFIIKGKYKANPELAYLTYLDIRPYVPVGASTNAICDHLNIMEPDLCQYFAVRPDLNYTKDYLVCRAVRYEGAAGEVRGGIILTEELGIPPVMSAVYPGSRAIIESVSKDKHVDFFSFAEGRYAYYGRNQWEDGHKARASAAQLAEEARQRIIDKKRKESAARKLDLTLEEFMALHKKANPLWIPPPGDLRILGGRSLMQMLVPQKHLRAILDRQPALKKKVYQEFLKLL